MRLYVALNNLMFRRKLSPLKPSNIWDFLNSTSPATIKSPMYGLTGSGNVHKELISYFSADFLENDFEIRVPACSNMIKRSTHVVYDNQYTSIFKRV